MKAMKKLVLLSVGVALWAGALLAGCSPADLLANQGSRIRSTDYVQLGVDEQRKRDREEAEQKRRAEAEQEPIRKRAMSAQAHADLFEYREAVADWKEAYRLSQDPAFLLRLAEAQRAMGDCVEATQMYQQYLEKRKDAPDAAQVQERLAETKTCQNRAGTNVEAVRKHYQAGVTHYELSEYDGAIKEFKEAYRLSNDPAYLFNIAQSYRLQRKCTDAMQYYQRYLTNAGDLPNKDKVQARIDEMRACAK